MKLETNAIILRICDTGIKIVNWDFISNIPFGALFERTGRSSLSLVLGNFLT